jgi:hypothetical protein
MKPLDGQLFLPIFDHPAPLAGGRCTGRGFRNRESFAYDTAQAAPGPRPDLSKRNPDVAAVQCPGCEAKASHVGRWYGRNQYRCSACGLSFDVLDSAERG